MTSDTCTLGRRSDQIQSVAKRPKDLFSAPWRHGGKSEWRPLFNLTALAADPSSNLTALAVDPEWRLGGYFSCESTS